MRDVLKTFTKSQLKILLSFLRKAEKKYPEKFTAMLALLKEQGFLYIDGDCGRCIIADPDYKGD